LQSLSVSDTPVTDLGPLAGLAALPSLNCSFSYTGVTDLGPLAGLCPGPCRHHGSNRSPGGPSGRRRGRWAWKCRAGRTNQASAGRSRSKCRQARRAGALEVGVEHLEQFYRHGLIGLISELGQVGVRAVELRQPLYELVVHEGHDLLGFGQQRDDGLRQLLGGQLVEHRFQAVQVSLRELW
jgi:hypothetical protein